MRFLLLHHFGGIGGGTISCIDVAKALRVMGHTVRIGIVNPTSQTKKVLRSENIPFTAEIPTPIVFNYHSASRSQMKCLLKYIYSSKNRITWKKFFESCSDDVIVFNSMVQAPLITIAKDAGKKTVVFVRETRIEGNRDLFNRHLHTITSLTQ